MTPWSPLQLKDQVVILIDDRLATGISMLAAIQSVQLQAPARIV
jgi:predicted phosphoribosyltransferase